MIAPTQGHHKKDLILTHHFLEQGEVAIHFKTSDINCQVYKSIIKNGDTDHALLKQIYKAGDAVAMVIKYIETDY